MKAILMLGMMLTLGVSATAQVPLQFTYQGRLTDAAGVPVTGTVTGVFRIIEGGTELADGNEVFNGEEGQGSSFDNGLSGNADGERGAGK